MDDKKYIEYKESFRPISWIKIERDRRVFENILVSKYLEKLDEEYNKKDINSRCQNTD
jgi:hypothetical protein